MCPARPGPRATATLILGLVLLVGSSSIVVAGNEKPVASDTKTAATKKPAHPHPNPAGKAKEVDYPTQPQHDVGPRQL